MGFTLVEALVALLVLAFGMLAVAGFALNMPRYSEVAKQRSDAIRLARAKMEELGAFEKIASDASRFDYAEDVVDGVETIGPTQTSHTSFRRSWAVTREDGVSGAGANDPMKWLAISVAWADRAGNAQSVVLRSIVARSDPTLVSTLVNVGTHERVRPLRARSAGVPHAATDLGRGKSGFVPPGAVGMFYVIDNSTAEIERVCHGTPRRGFDVSECATRRAFLLSGFIRFDASEAPSVESVTNPAGPTRELTPSVSFLGMPDAHPPAQCFAQRQRVLRNTSSGEEIVLPEGDSQSGFSEVVAAFVAYACAIEPFIRDGSRRNAGVWSGQFVIMPKAARDGAWTIGGGVSNFRLCRYSGDYNGDDRLSNSEHPLVYRGVSSALLNQNYVVVPGNCNCPVDGKADPSRGKVVNANTLLHQIQPIAMGSPPYGGLLSIGQWAAGAETDGATAYPML